jgi:hypothetical protein
MLLAITDNARRGYLRNRKLVDTRKHEVEKQSVDYETQRVVNDVARYLDKDFIGKSSAYRLGVQSES